MKNNKNPEKPVFSAEARLWHSAFLGKTGSGKTYAARGEVEDLLNNGAQVIIIDPTGAWPGLRMNPDGSPSGHNIAIFGGEFGDRPLTPDMAAGLGRIAGHNHQSMILDLSGISLELEDQREIVYQFLKSLYRVNRKPLHLVIDEADEFSPQELDKDTKALRTLIARIMARGRSLGFRCTLITQRPAKIDKNSISQVESMAVLRVTAPQDRKAIMDWFDDKGGDSKKEIMGGLGSLKTGEGWVFTGLNSTYEHRQFRKTTTYDSSQTPIDDDGNETMLDTGWIDLADVDEQVVYPEETSEEELEKAIARRRNLEQDLSKMRARVLRSDARYESMRRVFVEIRRVVDSILTEDELEAIDFADLLLLRNEVDEDQKDKLENSKIVLSDVKGEGSSSPIDTNVYPITQNNNQSPKEEPKSVQNPNVIPDIQKFMQSLPTRKMTANEQTIIHETEKQPAHISEIKNRCGIADPYFAKAFQRLTGEGSLRLEKEVLYLGGNAIIRQMTENQISATVAIMLDETEIQMISGNTAKALARVGIIKNDMLTQKGRQVGLMVIG